MIINVNLFDLVEVKYLDENRKPQTEFFSGSIDLAKEFVKSAPESNFIFRSATYFVELMIREDNSHIAIQPSKRFAEKSFSSVETFLSFSDEAAGKIRTDVNDEVDSYMAEVYPGANFKS